MRKFLAIAACALFVSAAQAGVPVTYGVRAGMNVSNMKMKEGGSSEKFGTKVGFHVGAIVDIPVFKQYLYVQPGLSFTQKGAKDSEGGLTETLNPLYLEIPILLSGRYDINKKVQVQVSFGPYFAAGLCGKDKEKWGSETDKEDFFGDGVKRFDAGLSVGAGVLLMKHYFVGIQYEAGLANIFKASGDYKC